ncbi:MAG: extracellular solute-binding protein [Candidatus Hydrogenedentes bacterium]|nr:extracellular solute-binding protein [Candidatus Hydrogenedentota bacterium]
MPMLTCCAMMSALAGAGEQEVSGELVVFHAGSLSVPMQEIAGAFMKEHPGVRVLREAAGSRESARKISELQRPCDILASADYAVIDSLLIPEFADWNIRFAGNEMAIVYRGESRHAGELTAENWFKVLLSDDVAFGRSDPNSDPCGYRTILTLKLAETYYRQPGLAARFLEKDTRYIRPKETDLLALLETGNVDYVFLYRSVAIQHGLKWLPLPDSINLKTPALADRYAAASVELTGKEPGTVVTQKGEAMVYGVTIPKNAPNPAAAEAFLEFLLSKDKGQAIMEKQGQPSVVPSPATNYNLIPERLKPYALP